MTLEQLQKQEQELTQQLAENKRAQYELKCQAVKDKYGYGIGTVIEVVRNGKTGTGVISEMTFYAGSNLLYMGVNFYKKDGQPSLNATTIYSDEIKTIKVISQ